MEATAPRASVIVVNWNGRAFLPDCLDSLAAQTYRDFEVVLVDNGSNDGSCDLVRERYPWVRLLALLANSGFAAGNNRGFELARGEFLVTLNNDTRVDPGWLAALVEAADADPRIGMVASRICALDEPDRIDSLGVRVCRDGMSRGAQRHRRFSALRVAEREPILFPSACAALYRRAMLEETGWFDEEFFAYCEDTDLGLRGRLLGWQAVLARDAVVLHRYSQTGGSFSPLKLYLVERNHYWVALKCFPLRLLLLLPLFTALRYLEQARATCGGHGSGGEFRASGNRRQLLGAVARGLRDALRGMPRMLRRRRQLQAQARLSGSEMERLLADYRLTFRELLDFPET